MCRRSRSSSVSASWTRNSVSLRASCCLRACLDRGLKSAPSLAVLAAATSVDGLGAYVVCAAVGTALAGGGADKLMVSASSIPSSVTGISVAAEPGRSVCSAPNSSNPVGRIGDAIPARGLDGRIQTQRVAALLALRSRDPLQVPVVSNRCRRSASSSPNSHCMGSSTGRTLTRRSLQLHHSPSPRTSRVYVYIRLAIMDTYVRTYTQRRRTE